MIAFWLEWGSLFVSFRGYYPEQLLPILANFEKKKPDAWASIRSQPYRFEDGYNLLQTNKNTMELFAQNFLFL